ncbi:MAG: homoserine dehydrogenase [SAR324 cluster bacterium]|nr:homoserine dehydrogenase [SAR324 cluster bacterium]
MNNQTIQVAIAGLGTIGSGVATVIQDHAAKGSDIKLVKILETHPEGQYAKPLYQRYPSLFTDNCQTIVTDPNIDVIVETIGGCTFAKTLVEEALKHGKHVVSANKDLLATEGKGLLELAQQSQKHFLFEASVGGAIPIIRLLESYLSLSDVQKILGIVNGTTNYILSEMDLSSISFKTALSQAQAKGFAEQDPTNDIKGYDARYKITILIYLATGIWLPVEAITVEGIDTLELPDFDYANRMNCKIKLIAYFSREHDQLQAFVLPLMLPQEHTLAKVTGSTNIVAVKGKYSDEISIVGKGAGTLPTASAIVSDIYKTREPVLPPPFRETGISYQLQPFSEYVFKHTLRFDAYDQPGIVGNIGAILAKHGINIYALEQLPQYHHYESSKDNVIFTLTLEACQEGLVQKAIAELNQEPYMAKPVFVLRELCD